MEQRRNIGLEWNWEGEGVKCATDVALTSCWATGQYQPVPAPWAFAFVALPEEPKLRLGGLSLLQVLQRKSASQVTLVQVESENTEQGVRRLAQNGATKEHLVWVTLKQRVGSRVPEKGHPAITASGSVGR